MYGKFFSSTFTGSMYGAGANVFAVWGYVIANTMDSRIELNPAMLASILGSSKEDIEKAIDYLCQPDPQSRNHDCEGRRMVREGQFQYRVVSHALYRAMRNDEQRRTYNRERQREWRAKHKENKESQRDCHTPSQPVTQPNAGSLQSEAESETKKPSRASASSDPRFAQFVEDWDKAWTSMNPQVPMSFGAKDGKNLSAFLRDNPKLGRETWRMILRNRAKSDVNRAQSLCVWIGKALEFTSGPLDRYGKPTNGSIPVDKPFVSGSERLKQRLEEIQ